jgi:thioredoxin reductase (NADPH)
MVDVLIIGGGPAGLTAAVYTARAGLSTMVLSELSGGQVAETGAVENYPGFASIFGPDLAQKLTDHALSAGADIQHEAAVEFQLNGSVKTVRTAQGEYQAQAVILAQGSRRRKLKIPGEAEFTGHGVSWCASCDGNFFRNRVTAVVGGGNTAVGDAIELAALCKTVYLLVRHRLKAEYSLVKKVQSLPNVRIVYGVSPVRIEGGQKVECIVVKHTGSGEEAIPVDGVFVAVGIEPNTELLPPSFPLSGGFIEAPETGVTPVAGVFAAGDLRKKDLYQIVTAVSDGANAAYSAQKYLQRNPS